VVLSLRHDRALRAGRRGLTAPAIALGCACLAALVWFGPMRHAGRYQANQIVDTPVYQGYADRVAKGDLPYRDFQVEYPPLAFAAFLPPRAVASSPHGYRVAFEREMGLLLVVAAAATAMTAAAAGLGAGRIAAAGGLVALGPALAGGVSMTRFDLWPVALVALALWAAAAGRDVVGGALLGLATAAKLWPALVAAPLVALAVRRGGRLLGSRVLVAFAAALAVPLAIALALSPSGLWHALTVQASRPLQIESTAAVALVSLYHLGIGGPLGVVTSAGSQNLSGSGVRLAAAVTSGVALAAVAGLTVLGARRLLAGRDASVGEAARWSLAAVAATLAFGRVLSPQFVLWLLPFPLLVRGGRAWLAAALVVLALGLTQAEFPHRYWSYADAFDATATAIVLARDLTLVCLVAALAIPYRSASDAG
jgi:hypothetical protein